MNKLQRRAWAEKMQSRNMRHFFDQDFYEVIKQSFFLIPIVVDLSNFLFECYLIILRDIGEKNIPIKMRTATTESVLRFWKKICAKFWTLLFPGMV